MTKTTNMKSEKWQTLNGIAAWLGIASCPDKLRAAQVPKDLVVSQMIHYRRDGRGKHTLCDFRRSLVRTKLFRRNWCYVPPHNWSGDPTCFACEETAERELRHRVERTEKKNWDASRWRDTLVDGEAP